MMFCYRCFLRSNQVRSASTKIKIVPQFNTDIHDNVANANIKPKNHPGVMKISPPQVPDKLLTAIRHVVRDKSIKTLVRDGEAFKRYLEGRHPPMDEETMKEHVNVIRNTAARHFGYNLENMTEEELKVNKVAVNNKIVELYKHRTYNWKPVQYDSYLTAVYLIKRTAPEYAVLYRIFYEISVRDKSFQPKTLFDFGSGVGSVSWAAKNFWNDSLKEFYCVDSSSHMNDVAQALIQDGKMKLEPPKGVYFRQFLPSKNVLYDIVVTAYTLFELPSKQARLETMLNLWQKTRKYLVIIEMGTNAGFKLVNEVREFILFSDKSKSESNAHVFAPCPHDMVCPRSMEPKDVKETPCNFEIKFYHLPLDNKIKIGRERFSFVVLKKGTREDSDKQWPRIVRPVMKRSRHSICRFCTANGQLKEVIFSASKHGKIPYRCARSSNWGDVLPVELNEEEVVITDDNLTSKTH